MKLDTETHLAQAEVVRGVSAEELRVLSMRQPWLWAALHAQKGIENRRWNTRYRGPILLHAAKGCTAAECEGALAWMEEAGVIEPHDARWPGLNALPRGAIVGRARIVDVIPPLCNESHAIDILWRGHGIAVAQLRWWMRAQHGFVLKDVVALPTPIPCKGALGLFRPPLEVLQHLEAVA